MNTTEWITDRRPTEQDACKDADSVLYECVILPGYDYKLYRKWYNVKSGEAWKPIPECESYVKQPRFTSEWSIITSCWVILYRNESFHYYYDLDDKDKHREAAEKIAAVLDEVMP
jgi:hypothetical protein